MQKMRLCVQLAAWSAVIVCLQCVANTSEPATNASKKITKQEIAALLQDLSSGEHNLRHQGAQALAQLEAEGINIVLQAYQNGELHGANLSTVFGYVSTPEARQKLGDLLLNNDFRIKSEAAWALEEHKDPALVPKMQSAIRTMLQERKNGVHLNDPNVDYPSRDTAEYYLIQALWATSPTKENAQLILELARLIKDYETYAIIDNPIGHALMTEEERLDYSINYLLYMGSAGPGALDFSMKHNTFLDAEEWTFIGKYRDTLLPQMRIELKESGGVVPTILLAYFKDTEALLDLRELFLGAESCYGWEGSYPNILAYNQYSRHHCYEEAIEAITGAPIEEYIDLSEDEVTELKTRYHNNEESALYVLYRLEPEVAAQVLSSEFKSKEKTQRYESAYMLSYYFLKNGMSEDHVRNLMGQADSAEDNTWSYDIGEDQRSCFCVLKIFFNEKKLSDRRIAYRDEVNKETQH